MSKLVYIDLVPSSVRDAVDKKVRSIADKLDIDPNWIMIVFHSESGLKPTIANSIGCVGLIQFCPDKAGGSTKTIQGVKYNLNTIRYMSWVDQIEVCYKYWYTYRNSISDLYDLYLATFYPYAMDKGNSYKYGSQVSDAMVLKVAKQNPAISNGHTYINNALFQAYINEKIKKAGISSGVNPMRYARKFVGRNLLGIAMVSVGLGIGYYFYKIQKRK